MKQNKSVLIIFLSLILSCFFLSGDVFAYKQSDLNKFENTRKCIKCDLTDLNLSRVNLSRVNLSGSNLSGSDLSESDLSGSNLSGVNLSGVNLNGSNLKDVNLTYANLSEIIIDEKAFSTLDFSEFTFMNKSTLAEETKKKKEQALRKKKEKELRKKKEQALRKKKEQALRKKKEQALQKKKEQALQMGIEKFKSESLTRKESSRTTIKTCYVNTVWNGLNWFIFPDDGGKPYGAYVETLLSFTNKLNLDIEFIEEKASKPYLNNCYKRMRNGEIDIMSGLYDKEIVREIMELIPTYRCPATWNCKGNKHHNIGISKESKFISRISEFKSAVLSEDEFLQLMGKNVE